MSQPELAQPSPDRPGATQSAATQPDAEELGTLGSADPVALGLIPANVPGAFRAPRPPDDFDPRTASRAALARYGLPWRSARRRIRLRSGRCGSARWPRRGWPAAGWSCGLCRGPG